MNRVFWLLDELLPLLASFSGVVVPISGARLEDVEAPSLEQQLHEIVNFVAFRS